MNGPKKNFTEIGKDVFFKRKVLRDYEQDQGRPGKKWGGDGPNCGGQKVSKEGEIYFKGSFRLVVKLRAWEGGEGCFVSFDS